MPRRSVKPCGKRGWQQYAALRHRVVCAHSHVGAQAKGEAIWRFVIGLQGVSVETLAALHAEQASSEDLLLIDDLPSVHNRQTERVIRAALWAYEHADVDYMLKVVDSTVVNWSEFSSRLGSIRKYARRERHDCE
jgi:hypothetical protein